MNMDKVLKVSIIAGVLIAGLSVAYYFVVFLPRDSNSAQKTEALNKQIALQEVEAKKQSLLDFYNVVSEANDNRNWSVLYESIPQTLRDSMTKDQYVAYREKPYKDAAKIFVKETTVNGVRVEGDRGFVDRTIVTCITDDCSGENRQEDKGEKEYVFANGKWQQPDLELSERALSASSSLYLNVISELPEKEQQDFLNRYSYDTGSVPLAIKLFAAELDSDLQRMITVEQSLEKIAGKTGRTSGSAPVRAAGAGSGSSLDRLIQEQQQDCQQDLAKYNSCLSKYNTELAEYNACLSENADPDKSFKSFCSKPFSSCFKPVCAY